jgi:signal transduction histidine kinase
MQRSEEPILLRATMTGDRHNPQVSTLSDPGELIGMIGTFAESLTTAKDLSDLGRHILTGLSRLVGCAQGAMWIQDPEAQQYNLLMTLHDSVSLSLPPTVPTTHAFLKRLADTPGPLQFLPEAKFPNQASPATMQSLCIHLGSPPGLAGLCILGPLEAPIQMSEAESSAVNAMARIGGTVLSHHIALDQTHRSSILIRRTDRLRSLEIMAGGFAHEIRNPLTSIKTFIQLAPQRQQDPVFIGDFSRLALEDVHRIERLLHEIMDYARYMAPEPSDVDLNEVVTSCLCFISSTASQRGICLRTALAPDLPNLSLDRQQIKQVLLNLLLNALDAIQGVRGLICVKTQLLSSVNGITRVRLQVEDDGCGIAPEHLDRIFDPFFTTKHCNSHSDGSGLGLTTAHQIIQDHGGTLTVKSQVGMGSTFSVDLPVPSVRTTVSAVRE